MRTRDYLALGAIALYALINTNQDTIRTAIAKKNHVPKQIAVYRKANGTPICTDLNYNDDDNTSHLYGKSDPNMPNPPKSKLELIGDEIRKTYRDDRSITALEAVGT